MKLYGVEDDYGDIYAAYRSPAEVPGLETVELVENITWAPSDFTDPETGNNYVRSENLADLFTKLCKISDMKKKDLAKLCGKNAVTFSRYCNGQSPVPQLVWENVDRIRKAVKGE